MIENFSVLGYQDLPFAVSSDWFTGKAKVRTFALNEMLGTKMRALYQRRKGRDLFDLWYALSHCDCSPEQIVSCFKKYMEHESHKITRKDLQSNLEEKQSDRRFLSDIPPLIRTGLDLSFGISIGRRIQGLIDFRLAAVLQVQAADG